MSKLKTSAVQLGDNATATQNFTLRTNNDGTGGIYRGNVGSTTQDILTWDAAGKVSLPGSSYTSSAQAVAANTIITLAHGLGVVPRTVQVMLRCKVADIGHAIGDEIEYSSGVWTGAAQIIRIQKNATNIKINHAGAITESRGDTTAQASITASSWEWIVRAQA